MELIFVIVCGLAALVVGITTVLYLNERSLAKSVPREGSSVRGGVHPMQSAVESWKQVGFQQFFDDIQLRTEDLQSVTKAIKEPTTLSIEEVERLIKLLGESQNLLGSGEEDLTDIRHDLWKVVNKLVRRRLFFVVSNSSDENRQCAALWQLSQMENDKKTIAFFDKIANDPNTPAKVAKVAKEAKQEAISVLMSKAESEDEIELSTEEAEAFVALNEGLDSLNESLDRLIAAVKGSADDYSAATKQIEEMT